MWRLQSQVDALYVVFFPALGTLDQPALALIGCSQIIRQKENNQLDMFWPKMGRFAIANLRCPSRTPEIVRAACLQNATAPKSFNFKTKNGPKNDPKLPR